jgi:hypothetical protein
MPCLDRLSQWKDEVSTAFGHVSKPQVWDPVLWSVGIVLAGTAGMTQISASRCFGAGVTTPHGSKPGASGMTPVSRPTPLVRFMPMSETNSKQLMHCMAHETAHTVVFLPVALRNGTRTLFSCLCAKELPITSFSAEHKWKCRLHPAPKGARLSSPWLKRRGIQARRLVRGTSRVSVLT